MVARGWITCPDAFVVTIVSAVAGAFAFIYPPQIVVSKLVLGVRIAWAIAYLLGGILRLTGILGRWMKLEAAGCILLAGAGVVYGGTVLVVIGPRGSVSALAFVGIAAAATTRWLEILHIGRKVKEAS